MQVVYFVNSGSEANDMAMMMARLYTGNYDIMCLRNAYHGMSIGTMGTCGQHTWKQPFPHVSKQCRDGRGGGNGWGGAACGYACRNVQSVHHIACFTKADVGWTSVCAAGT